MTAFISWYLLITLIGWLAFPLTYRLFPALADRGYTLMRAFGLLVWGYAFWLLASLRVAQNDSGGLLLGLIALGSLSMWAIVNRRSEIRDWLGANRRLILTTELLFLVSFGFMAIVRAANPEIVGTEKPMELMLINGIMNSSTFPPRDLWLSGYAISYYHFGYVMTSMFGLFTGTPATMAFNLMIALVFGLSAIGAYGIVYNLLVNHELRITGDKPVSGTGSSISALLAPLFLLFLSNVEGFLEVLHRKGLFWQFNADGSASSAFWAWLDIKEIRDAPSQPLQWIPDRFWWWWRASRVVQDYDLNGTFREAIDEFPFFSYLLGDLHPHVLSMPFLLLAVAIALNLFFGGWRGRINLWLGQLRVNREGFLVIALTLGGLAFLNTWDILVAAALIVLSYALSRVLESGWGWERAEDILLLGIPAAVTAFVMYLPFFIGFDSQAGGPTPNFMYPTRGAHLWVMWGTLFIPLFAYLVYLWRGGAPAHWGRGIAISLGIVTALLVAMLTIGFTALKLRPEIILPILESQGLDLNAFIGASMSRRLSYIGSLITLLALLIPTVSFLSANRAPEDGTPQSGSSAFSIIPTIFVLLLIVLGILLILGIDFIYLRDQFGYRINSIFKFYYQAWILLSLASAYGAALMLRNLRGAGNVVFSLTFAVVLIVGLTYPAFGIFNKTNHFKPPSSAWDARILMKPRQ
jgi:YYY domain-containing protein